MKINPYIKKDFAKPFRIFFAHGQYIAQWDFVPDSEIAGWGNITEDSVHPCGDYAKDVAAIIALRYTFADELALERQKESKAEAFAEYNDFCEAAKAAARQVMEG